MTLFRLLMWRLLIALVALGLLVTASHGQTAATYESLTVADTAVGFTATIIQPTNEAAMTRCRGRVETAAIRYRFDGTDPTASEGVLVNANDVITIEGYAVLSAITFIRDTSTSAVLKVHCTR